MSLHDATPRRHTPNGEAGARAFDPVPPRAPLTALGVEVLEIAGQPALRFPGLAAALPGRSPVYDPQARDPQALKAYVEALRLDGEGAAAWRPLLTWEAETQAWTASRPDGAADEDPAPGPDPRLPAWLAEPLGLRQALEDGLPTLRFPGWAVGVEDCGDEAAYYPAATTAQHAAWCHLSAADPEPETVARLRAWRPVALWSPKAGVWVRCGEDETWVGGDLCEAEVRRCSDPFGGHAGHVGARLALAGVHPAGWLLREPGGRLRAVPREDVAIQPLVRSTAAERWEIAPRPGGGCAFLRRRPGRPDARWVAEDARTAALYALAVVQGLEPPVLERAE